MYNDYFDVRDRYLEHYGVKGMKWRFHKFATKAKLRTGLGIAKRRGMDLVNTAYNGLESTADSIRSGARKAAGSVAKAYTKLRVNLAKKRMSNKMRGRDLGSRLSKFGRNLNKFGTGVVKSAHGGVAKGYANYTKNRMTSKMRSLGGSSRSSSSSYGAGIKPNYTTSNFLGLNQPSGVKTSSRTAKKKKTRW